MKKITPGQLQLDIELLHDKLVASKKQFNAIYGVPRGGVPIAMLLSEKLGIPLVSSPDKDNILIVDDLIDSGETIKALVNFEYKQTFAVLYRKPHSPEIEFFVKEIDDWLEFFYEDTQTDDNNLIVRLLERLGEDPNREGLAETPKRVIKFYKEFMSPPDFNFTTFDNESYDEMIVQKNIPFFSLCEHHMAPFFGYAHVAYIPRDKIVGLSKLARTVELYSRRLQNQERITSQIAERLQEELNPLGVAVTLSARHFCMEMRGVKTHDVFTTTTKLLGAFKDEPSARAEYMEMIK
ncbi:GTP cyclohydrolase I FolE [Polynucleobacter sp.]|uniref:GTP cyclohydrolase I FolE n=1 Tax=Polynucleobacter sp. TaxID=2029855 RepID=UPI003F69DE22